MTGAAGPRIRLSAMSDVGQGLVRAFRAVDRLLGGERPPTRTRRCAARHSVVLGPGSGAVWTAYFPLLPEARSSDLPLASACGALLGAIVGAAAGHEGRRQRRLLRPGRWDGR